MKSPIKIHRKGKDPAPPTNGAVPSNGTRPVVTPNVAVPMASSNGSSATNAAPPNLVGQNGNAETLDLERRRAQLAARVAELQWDLGGLAYEMAVRNRMHPDVLVKRAAVLQEADAELGEVERILRMERTGVAALCLTCGAPHSAGAVFCWQCGTSLLEQVPGRMIAAPKP